WGLNDNCGYSYQADNFKWGNSATIYGKSDIVGTGSLNWGYSIDYKGGGNTESWTCYGGGACAMQGGLVRAYNAQSFMNTPTAASPQWNHIQNQNIPATSSCGTCSVLGKLAMAELQKIVHATPVVSTILDFVVPTDFTVQNYSEITSDRHGNGGGGVNINTALTSSKKQVDGEHSWRFNGYGSWAWGIEASNDLYGEFHACQYCGWDQQTWSYWWDTTHVAKVRAS
ncbi:MAG: hypothetical protein QOI63_595, partial [Thermoplasmata archaeon]|nr:hypothetical protein [Thermoplasmata archaeon]